MNVKKDLAVLGNTKMDGTLTVKGLGQFDNNINLTKVETAGGGCSPNGLLSRDAKGSILTCQLGAWKKEGTTEAFATIGVMGAPASCYIQNTQTGGCNCSAGKSSFFTGFSYAEETPYFWYYICRD